MLKVKAAPGIKIPLEYSHQDSIPPGRIMQVDDSHYYRSMINDGDLLEVSEAEWQAQVDADAKAEADAIAADAKVKAAAVKAASKPTANN